MKPDAFVSRKWDTGEVLNELLFDTAAETRLGGPFINIHRADLHDVLRSPLPDGSIHFDHMLGRRGTSRKRRSPDLQQRSDARRRHRRRRGRHPLPVARCHLRR